MLRNPGVVRQRAYQTSQQSGVTSPLPAAAIIVGLASLLVLVQTSSITSEGYNLRRLEEVREDWRQRNYQLEAEIASLQSLGRIEREARERLKMIPAGQRTYIVVNAVSSTRELPDDAPPSFEKQTPTSQGTAWWEQLVNKVAFWRTFG